jgi:hypothetical protein
MDQNFTQDFNKYICDNEEEKYLLTYIASRIAPTLINVKPSSLVSINNHARNNINNWDKNKDSICRILNVNYFELGKTEKHANILFYKEVETIETIERAENKCFLNSMGYNSARSLEDLLQLFEQRFKVMFPHEIGIILGYPFEDVRDFIKNKGANYLLRGYWKVYHNPHRAIRIFNEYDKAKAIILNAIGKCCF